MFKDPNMSRRSFLEYAGKMLAGLSLFGLSAGQANAMGQTEKPTSTIAPSEEQLPVKANPADVLHDCITTDLAQTTLIGVDHTDSELDSYRIMQFKAKDLKNAGISKVFVEVTTVFSDLFEKAAAGEIERAPFIKEYFSRYPDDAQWRATASREEVEITESTKAVLYDMVVALAQHDIKVIPYDRRWEEDLLVKAGVTAEIANAEMGMQEERNNRILDRKYPTWTPKNSEEAYFEKTKEERLMMQEENLAAMRLTNILNFCTKDDAKNLEYIDSHTSGGENILIIAGDTHINKQGALRNLVEKRNGKTKSISFLSPMNGDLAGYIRAVKDTPFIKTTLPDYFIHAKTGVLIETKKLKQPHTPEIDHTRRALLKLGRSRPSFS